LWQFLATLLVVGFIAAYRWVIALVIAAVVLACGMVAAFYTYESSPERIAKREVALAARADQQHSWVMQGDERGA